MYLIDIEPISDSRGFFARSFDNEEFLKYGLNVNFVQNNISCSLKKYTLRGLHVQLPPYGEDKFVRCTQGSLYDVVIDLRKDSPSYLKWVGIELNSCNFQQLYIPKGCAHGFLTLEDNTSFFYQVTSRYAPGMEFGIRWNDPYFQIAWPHEPVHISEKDISFPDFCLVP